MALLLLQLGGGPCLLSATAPRVWPSTWDGIHVFPDQLCHVSVDSSGSWLGAHPNLLAWVAEHYAGTQKIPPSMADAIRQHNPDFLVLHYRLGNLLGGNATVGGTSPEACNFQDRCTKIWSGDTEICAYPGDDVIKPDWFYQVRGSDNSSYVMCPAGEVGHCDAGEICVPGDEPGTVDCQAPAEAAMGERKTAAPAPIHCDAVSADKPRMYCSTETVSRQHGCKYGAWNMNISNQEYSAWWIEQVLSQIDENHADGLFADSFGQPHDPCWHLGYNLPRVQH